MARLVSWSAECVRTLALLWWLAAVCQSRRRAGETSTLIQRHHSRQVAACRRKGNLYAYYEPLDRCMPLLEDMSPCSQLVHVLVLNATTLEAQCMLLPCNVTHVLLPNGRCHTKQEFCSHAEDKELVLKETGYGTCDCPDMHVYWLADDRCYAAYTRGPCAAGQYVVFREGAGVLCEETPCPEEQVPWRGKCVPRRGHGCLDSAHGYLVMNPANLKYECTLRCPNGMVEVERDCHYLYSRGPCPTGQYVVHVYGSQQGRCAENPCGDDLVPWAGACWQRGQYCTIEGTAPVNQLQTSSRQRQPKKREPVRLPHDDHVFIVGPDELQIFEPPSPAESPQVEVATISEVMLPPQADSVPAQFDFTIMSPPPPQPNHRRQPVSRYQSAAPVPPSFTQRQRQPHAHIPWQPASPPESDADRGVWKCPPGQTCTSNPSVLPPPPDFNGISLSMLPPPPQVNQPRPRFGSSQQRHAPSQQAADVGRIQLPPHVSPVAFPLGGEPTDWLASTPAEPAISSQTQPDGQTVSDSAHDGTSGGELQHVRHPQSFSEHSPVISTLQDIVGTDQQSQLRSSAPTDLVRPSPRPIRLQFVANSYLPPPPDSSQPPTPFQRIHVHGSAPNQRQRRAASDSLSDSSPPQPHAPPPWYRAFLPAKPAAHQLQGQICTAQYSFRLPPAGFEQPRAETKPAVPQPTEEATSPPLEAATIASPLPVQRRRRERRLSDFVGVVSSSEDSAATRHLAGQPSTAHEVYVRAPSILTALASQRLDESTAGREGRRLDTSVRIAELQEQHGFHTIDIDHPFSGSFETTSEVHGLHININPLTYEVECSDSIGYYRTISFAHYKCRPGSRRDLLGECHHEGPSWIDYHPDRCPFGMRHNLLTGKCIRST